MKTYILLAVFGVLGVYLRYGLNLRMSEVALPIGPGFPLSTLLVNVVGSLLIGYLYSSQWAGTDERDLAVLVAVGFLGALTTFSSYSMETLKLFQQGAVGWALVNVGANNILGISACFIGTKLGTILQ